MAARPNPYLAQQKSNQPYNAAAGVNKSVANAAIQGGGRSSGDPFNGMVNHAMALNSATGRPLRIPGSTAYVPSGWNHSAVSQGLEQQTGGGEYVGGDGGLPPTAPIIPPGDPGYTPPVTPPTDGGTTLGTPSGGRGRASTPAHPGVPSQTPAPTTPAATAPSQYGEGYDADVQRYASNPGYEWLKEPQYYGVIADFRNDAAAKGWNTTDKSAKGYVDITDWLANRFPDLSNPQAGRQGYDTYNYNADGTPKIGEMNIAPNSGGYNPEGTIDHFGPNHEALDQGGHPILGPDGKPKYAAGYGPEGNTPGYGTTNTPPVGTPGGPVAPPPPGTTPTGTPGTGPGAPPPPTEPPATAPQPPGTPGAAAAPPGGTGSDIVKQLYGLLNPTFDTAQNDYLRKANAQNALVGGGDAGASGGYATATNRGLADLVGQQSGQVADIAAKASESEKDRALAREGLNQQKAIADMGNEVDRLKITTDDQLQRWLNDPKNDTLQKYGIDKNDLLARYQTITGLQATQGAAVNKSAMSQAMAGALNQSNQQQMQLQRQQMQNQYNLGLGGLDVTRENNLMNFMLGQGGLSNDAIKSLMTSLGLTPAGTVAVKP